jgi:hypothetical protein
MGHSTLAGWSAAIVFTNSTNSRWASRRLVGQVSRLCGQLNQVADWGCHSAGMTSFLLWSSTVRATGSVPPEGAANQSKVIANQCMVQLSFTPGRRAAKDY